MDEWLIRLVITLYTECTVVRTDAGQKYSFEVKVGSHQGSLLPSELLYADNLVLSSYVINNGAAC